MSPRRYDMSRRREDAAAETKRRIVEATLRLHGDRGIFGTSWSDIAQEADVAIGTVYRYFPSLDELVPACGELLMERTRPPQVDDIGTVVGDATNPAERLERVAAALFAFYARGGKHLESDLRERELPAVREWEEYLRSTVGAFVREALKDAPTRAKVIDRLCFLFDVPTFAAMRTRGISPDEAARTVTELAIRWLGLETNPVAGKTRGRRKRKAKASSTRRGAKSR